MAAENLPWTYREQIVDFIVKNSGGGAAMPALPAVNVDPFTGGGAYIPSAGPSATQPTAGYGSAPVTGGGWDPFTGAMMPLPLHPATALSVAPADYWTGRVPALCGFCIGFK